MIERNWSCSGSPLSRSVGTAQWPCDHVSTCKSLLPLLSWHRRHLHDIVPISNKPCFPALLVIHKWINDTEEIPWSSFLTALGWSVFIFCSYPHDLLYKRLLSACKWAAGFGCTCRTSSGERKLVCRFVNFKITEFANSSTRDAWSCMFNQTLSENKESTRDKEKDGLWHD